MIPTSIRTIRLLLTAATGLAFLASCSGGGGTNSALPTTSGASQGAAAVNAPAGSALVDTDTSHDPIDTSSQSILARLNTVTTIGSTIDPINGDQNPYGLDIAPKDAGLISAGDLVVCNFNDSSNTQGLGTTIIALHATAGSSPRRIAQDSSLLGCTALALAPNDNVWAAAFAANDNPIFTPSGALVTTLPGGPWAGPFGQVFAQRLAPPGPPAFYESNASDGSIIRININPGKPFTFDKIATGFAVNGGAPGSILGPSGLQYDAALDRLYIIDGADNSVVSFKHVSTIPAGGITVSSGTFGGPFAGRARLVFSGAPLNGPISSALLPGGHLVIGNTLDPDGQNLMVEINAAGRLLDVRNVDTGAAGAIFGMVASRNFGSQTTLYFNDDNDNAVIALTP